MSSLAAEKELFHSIDKFYDLYHLYLLLLAEMTDLEQKRIELRRNRNIQTADDLFPSTKLLDNIAIKKILDSDQLYSYKNERKLNWKVNSDFVKGIYNDFVESDLFKNYINSENDSFEEDKKFLNDFFAEFLAENENFSEFLEEENIYWNDDNSFAIIMVLKTIESIKQNGNAARILPLFKNEDDRIFAQELMRKTIVNGEEQLAIIQKHTKNWDTERIAQIDLLILQLAFTEFMEFSSIPVKVTMNEFIEISKYYSTSRSNVFINGVLDKIVKELKAEEKLNKKGRGLIE